MFVTNSLGGDLIGLVVAVLVVLIAYWKWTYQYWHRKNVPYLEPQIPFGNLTDTLRGREHISVGLKKTYDEMRNKGWEHGGIYIFNKPSYIPLNLDLVRNIMTKDFHHFMDREIYYNEKEPLQAHLVNLTGTKWKSLRSKLTPTFTSGKMRMMFQVMADCQDVLHQRMEEECRRKEPINIKEILACFTTNIIGSCAFGLDFNALEDENSAFRIFGKKMFADTKWKAFKRTFAQTFPTVAKLLDITLTDKEVADFIIKLVQDTVDYRQKNKYTRNDFMQMLINMNSEGDLTMDELASQCIVFYGAGFETSSTLMTFALYELAKNQDIQDKLRNEIRAVLDQHDNKITYDSIQDIKYLNQVIDETLRMHPPGALLNRKCVQDYKIPGQDLVLEKGSSVTIAVLGIHYDKEYYPNPTKFDPERFTEKNKSLRHPYAHLPFGEGPRNCIGMRFGLLQSKVGLVALLKDYKFSINEKTQEPMTYQPSSLVLAVEGELWLNAQKI